MVAQTSKLHIRVENDIKEQMLPPEREVPNAETRAAMEESRMMKAKPHARFGDADKLFAALEKPPECPIAPMSMRHSESL